MLEIYPVETDEDIDLARMLFAEYTDSLGFDLGFQDFEEEFADLAGAYAAPKGCLLLATCEGQAAGCVGMKQFVDGRANVEYRQLGLTAELAER